MYTYIYIYIYIYIYCILIPLKGVLCHMFLQPNLGQQWYSVYATMHDSDNTLFHPWGGT